jgi:hypothetical protein
MDRQFLDVLCRAQHDPNPDQIVDDRRRPDAIGTAGAHVIYQHCRDER